MKVMTADVSANLVMKKTQVHVNVWHGFFYEYSMLRIVSRKPQIFIVKKERIRIRT